jgi:hypothetical protein
MTAVLVVPAAEEVMEVAVVTAVGVLAAHQLASWPVAHPILFWTA